MNKLSAIREAKKVSQRKLAELSGVGHITIARIEMGTIDPRVSTMKALAKALKVKIDEIVD
jgi:transcriptional regulator with XRE-family HTH domain